MVTSSQNTPMQLYLINLYASIKRFSSLPCQENLTHKYLSFRARFISWNFTSKPVSGQQTGHFTLQASSACELSSLTSLVDKGTSEQIRMNANNIRLGVLLAVSFIADLCARTFAHKQPLMSHLPFFHSLPYWKGITASLCRKVLSRSSRASLMAR